MFIRLNDAEQRLSKYLAKQRYESNRSQGVVNNRVGPQSDEVTDLEGIAAEIAFCKVFNVYPDLETSCKDPADAYTTSTGATDVKATKYRNGRLLAVKGKLGLIHPDSYALMIGEFPNYRFVGFVASGELLDEKNLIDLGHGETFGVEQGRLHQTA
jgi:hypothetical protein